MGWGGFTCSGLRLGLSLAIRSPGTQGGSVLALESPFVATVPMEANRWVTELPDELWHHVIGFLSPVDTASWAMVCRSARLGANIVRRRPIAEWINETQLEPERRIARLAIAGVAGAPDEINWTLVDTTRISMAHGAALLRCAVLEWRDALGITAEERAQRHTAAERIEAMGAGNLDLNGLKRTQLQHTDSTVVI